MYTLLISNPTPPLVTLNDAGSWSSIAGLFITIATGIIAFIITNKLSSFKKLVLYKTRYGDLLNEYIESSEKLDNYVLSFDNKIKDITREIKRCKTILDDIVSKVPNGDKNRLKKIRDLLKKSHNKKIEEDKKSNWLCEVWRYLNNFKKENITKEETEKLITEINVSIGILESIQKDNSIIL